MGKHNTNQMQAELNRENRTYASRRTDDVIDGPQTQDGEDTQDIIASFKVEDTGLNQWMYFYRRDGQPVQLSFENHSLMRSGGWAWAGKRGGYYRRNDGSYSLDALNKTCEYFVTESAIIAESETASQDTRPSSDYTSAVRLERAGAVIVTLDHIPDDDMRSQLRAAGFVQHDTRVWAHYPEAPGARKVQKPTKDSMDMDCLPTFGQVAKVNPKAPEPASVLELKIQDPRSETTKEESRMKAAESMTIPMFADETASQDDRPADDIFGSDCEETDHEGRKCGEASWARCQECHRNLCARHTHKSAGRTLCDDCDHFLHWKSSETEKENNNPVIRDTKRQAAERKERQDAATAERQRAEAIRAAMKEPTASQDERPADDYTATIYLGKYGFAVEFDHCANSAMITAMTDAKLIQHSTRHFKFDENNPTARQDEYVMVEKLFDSMFGWTHNEMSRHSTKGEAIAAGNELMARFDQKNSGESIRFVVEFKGRQVYKSGIHKGQASEENSAGQKSEPGPQWVIEASPAVCIVGPDSPTAHTYAAATVSAQTIKTDHMVAIIKEADQDFEWYPTTPAMIAAVAEAMYFKTDSILDIGAGDGRVLQALAKTAPHAKLYSIEKSEILAQAQPDDIIPVGTDLFEQNLAWLPVGTIFCNPPYSEFEDWTVKIISEGHAQRAYIIIPQRWKESKLIADALKSRGATARVIRSDNFHKAERQARAVVDIVELSYPKKLNHYSDEVKDPFDQWFDANIDTFDHAEEIAEEERETTAGLARRFANSSIDEMVAAYREEYILMENNYRAIFKLDYALLKELGIDKNHVRDGLKKKMSGLKVKYWGLLFNRLDAITSRLSTASRKVLIDKLTANTSVEFTAGNAYQVVLWAVKNARQFFDSQLIDLFHALSSFENALSYKSNEKTWNKDGWRYIHSHGDEHLRPTRYALDYRIVVSKWSAINTEEWRDWDYPGGLYNSCHELIADTIAVLGNLGFSTGSLKSIDRKWESGQWQDWTNGKGDILFQVKAHKNGNLHYRFMPEAIKALNIEAGRLLKWVRSAQEVVSEMGYSQEEADQYFNSNAYMLNNPVKLLGLGRVDGEPVEVPAPSPFDDTQDNSAAQNSGERPSEAVERAFFEAETLDEALDTGYLEHIYDDIDLLGLVKPEIRRSSMPLVESKNAGAMSPNHPAFLEFFEPVERKAGSGEIERDCVRCNKRPANKPTRSNPLGWCDHCNAPKGNGDGKVGDYLTRYEEADNLERVRVHRLSHCDVCNEPVSEDRVQARPGKGEKWRTAICEACELKALGIVSESSGSGPVA